MSPAGTVKALVALDHDVALDADFAEFAALARNAFAAQIEHGWYAFPIGGGWRVSGAVHHEHQKAFYEWCQGTLWPDPYTAIVEAKAWHAANVEAKPAPEDKP
jgi:hypothetical protein